MAMIRPESYKPKSLQIAKFLRSVELRLNTQTVVYVWNVAWQCFAQLVPHDES